jgi:hypothetical protein
MPSLLRPCLEPLEDRMLLATVLPPNPPIPMPTVQMTGATTTDSRSVSVSYTVSNGNITGVPLSFSIFRSPGYNSLTGAQLIATASLPPSDTSDLSAGQHQGVKLSLTVPNGQPLNALTPNPALPFIVVLVHPVTVLPEDSSTAGGTSGGITASFETHVLGVVVHGFEFNLFGPVPAWETQMANSLQQTDGYEAVIPFNWVSQSLLPFGSVTVTAGRQLAQQVTTEADQLASEHPGDVVDVNFIGHSRGAVVVSQALQDLNGTTDPALRAGYLQLTLLDPHPANNAFGAFAILPNDPTAETLGALVYLFQFLAQDPAVVVPANVMQVQEFDEQTPAGHLFQTFYEFLINLWGELPSQLSNQSGQPIESMSLTNVNASGIGFIGHSEVHAWYQANVVNTDKTFTFFG